jgi:transposase-like protein
VRCPSCDSTQVVRNGWDDARHARQRWLCKGCKARFDDLTGTVLAGHKGNPAVVQQKVARDAGGA